MKKILIICLTLLLLTGCEKQEVTQDGEWIYTKTHYTLEGYPVYFVTKEDMEFLDCTIDELFITENEYSARRFTYVCGWSGYHIKVEDNYLSFNIALLANYITEAEILSTTLGESIIISTDNPTLNRQKIASEYANIVEEVQYITTINNYHFYYYKEASKCIQDVYRKIEGEYRYYPFDCDESSNEIDIIVIRDGVLYNINELLNANIFSLSQFYEIVINSERIDFK